jgi:response regulator of citrate/malate metabolism
VIRALIVEDDFRVAKVHAGFTERVDGFEVAGMAHTAAAALDAAARLRPDLVLLDVFLPDADGLEVQRRLAVSDHPPDVIFLTAMREMTTVRAAMRAGALSYLVKPFSFDALRERLVAYAELHARAGRGGEADQADIDGLFSTMRPARLRGRFPRGRSPGASGSRAPPRSAICPCWPMPASSSSRCATAPRGARSTSTGSRADSLGAWPSP